MQLNAALLRVHSARNDNFVELVRVAGLDPALHFRFANFEGMDFSNWDLEGFDFTGSDFTKALLGNADFSKAIIKGALFSDEENPRKEVARTIEIKRQQIIKALSSWLKCSFESKNQTCFENQDNNIRIVCTISKRYNGYQRYWFAYHPKWDDFLSFAARSYFVLGCMDLDKAFAIPREKMASLLPALSVSKDRKDHYWHIRIGVSKNEKYTMITSMDKNILLDEFEMRI